MIAPALAHIGGLPVEEALLQFAPAGVVLGAALQLARERTGRLRRVRPRSPVAARLDVTRDDGPAVDGVSSRRPSGP